MKTKKNFFGLLKRVMGRGNGTTVHVSSEIRIEPAMDGVESKAQSETAETKEPAVDKESANHGKAIIHNLIIVDESGSMSHLKNATILGVNETIKTIRNAQTEFAATQEHMLTLVTFDSNSFKPAVRTIIDDMPVLEVTEFCDYAPNGCTPLYDALGQSLTALYNKIKDNKDATAVVTVLTDGFENASREWRATELRALIEKLKNEGWSFSYMGSAHNVKEVSELLSIENVVEFSHDKLGAENTWERERASRRGYYMKMNAVYEMGGFDSDEEILDMKCRFAKEYYGKRVTPLHIDLLEPDEVFVFGSNVNGFHSGGAAASAMHRFGAQWGQGEGMQGQSYAIPTMEGLQNMADAVARFTVYARANPEHRFLVTRIGCSIAGYTADEVAPLFKECVALENVALPQDFWTVLGLKMY